MACEAAELPSKLFYTKLKGFMGISAALEPSPD
jgi:hypothetical protein